MKFEKGFKEYEVYKDAKSTFGIIFDEDDGLFYMYDLDLMGNIIDSSEGIVREVNQELFDELNAFFKIDNILSNYDLKVIEYEEISIAV